MFADQTNEQPDRSSAPSIGFGLVDLDGQAIHSAREKTTWIPDYISKLIGQRESRGATSMGLAWREFLLQASNQPAGSMRRRPLPAARGINGVVLLISLLLALVRLCMCRLMPWIAAWRRPHSSRDRARAVCALRVCLRSVTLVRARGVFF